jgi:hypothetical protein
VAAQEPQGPVEAQTECSGVNSTDANNATEGVGRRRSFKENFYGLAFDEHRLRNLAGRFKELAAELGEVSTVRVSVRSYDGETVDFAANIEALKDAELPQAIESADIWTFFREPGLRCRIYLTRSYASLDVEGKNAIRTRALLTRVSEK